MRLRIKRQHFNALLCVAHSGAERGLCQIHVHKPDAVAWCVEATDNHRLLRIRADQIAGHDPFDCDHVYGYEVPALMRSVRENNGTHVDLDFTGGKLTVSGNDVLSDLFIPFSRASKPYPLTNAIVDDTVSRYAMEEIAINVAYLYDVPALIAGEPPIVQFWQRTKDGALIVDGLPLVKGEPDLRWAGVTYIVNPCVAPY